MKLILAGIMLLSIINAREKWSVDEEEDDVAILTDDNFQGYIDSHDFVFVKFYAPWCGHCKSMAPGYAKLAKRMKDEEGASISQVDATVQTKLAEKYGVKGFPTLKFFVGGSPIDYQGAREEDAIYSWIQKKTGPASTLITSEEDLTKHASKKLALLFFAPEDDQAALKAFQAMAANYDDVPAAHSFSDDFRAKYELNQAYALVVFRDFDDGNKFLMNAESLTTDSMKEFFEGLRYPLVMDFDQKSAERIFGSQAPAMFLFSEEKESEQQTLFRAFAKERKGDILFALSTIRNGLGQRLSEFLGVTADMNNAVRIVKFDKGNLMKYQFVGDINAENLEKFLNDYSAGNLTAYFKSAPVPETNDEPVKVVVGDTFEDMVINSDKHVLVEAYAPWCGHCKKLEPIFTELAEKLAGVEDLLIVKMDATANEHPSMQVKGFPTLKFFKKGAKTATDFTGERTLEGFVSFLETQLGKKLLEGEEEVPVETDL
ncbi:MAG: protein disulfide-isomerase [Colwellia sp.]|nr:protein disulfide-isomerase [Colwellia sp.]